MKKNLSSITISLSFICLLMSLAVTTGSIGCSSIKVYQSIPAPGTTPPILPYEFILSSPGKDDPDRYSRMELESFLCACIPGFIQLKDVKRKGKPGIRQMEPDEKYFAHDYIVKRKTVDNITRDALEGAEINKWFEKRVTLVCKGYPLPEDIKVVKRFVDTINGIIGRQKFFYLEGAADTADEQRKEAINSEHAANIVLEFAPPTEIRAGGNYFAESFCLQDNLRVLIYKVKSYLRIDTYKAGYGITLNQSRLIRLSDAETSFRRKNRFVKIYFTDIQSPETRKMVILHELLHAIGLNGHSPYANSHLFPVPVVIEGRDERVILADTACWMVEMLYRPEILPGMSVHEAHSVLAGLKRQSKTNDLETAACLKRKRTILQEELAVLRKEALAVLSRKEEVHRLLDNLKEESRDSAIVLKHEKEIRELVVAKRALINTLRRFTRQWLSLND